METYKIEVYLPCEALDDIKNELYRQGFGKIGNYDCCLSWQKIQSSWRPTNDAKPYLGEIGKIEQAWEYKLEFRCDQQNLKQAIDTIKKYHPYEEVCINIIPLKII